MFGSTRYQMIKEMTVEEIANCLAQNSVGCPAVAQQDCKATRARTEKGQFTFCARCWLDFLNEEVTGQKSTARPPRLGLKNTQNRKGDLRTE